MAKAKYISEFELECIRIGVNAGATNAAIGRFLGRSKMAVGNHVKKMRDAGTIHDFPFPFVAEEIAQSIKAHEVTNV